MPRHRQDSGPVAVYRHLDAKGRTLYIGASLDPARRFGTHLSVSSWARQVASITLEWFDTRAEAEAAEAAAIASEDPPFNVQQRSTRAIKYVVVGHEGLGPWMRAKGLTSAQAAQMFGTTAKRVDLMVDGQLVPNGRQRYHIEHVTSGAVSGYRWGRKGVRVPSVSETAQ